MFVNKNSPSPGFWVTQELKGAIVSNLQHDILTQGQRYRRVFIICIRVIIWKTDSNNELVNADELFRCVGRFLYIR